jgi:hypothetical protein
MWLKDHQKQATDWRALQPHPDLAAPAMTFQPQTMTIVPLRFHAENFLVSRGIKVLD